MLLSERQPPVLALPCAEPLTGSTEAYRTLIRLIDRCPASHAVGDDELDLQAALLLCARLTVLSNSDEQLVRILLPQILVLALKDSVQPSVLGCAVYALAHVCVACARNSCR